MSALLAFVMGFTVAFVSAMAISFIFPELGGVTAAVLGFVISMAVSLFTIR